MFHFDTTFDIVRLRREELMEATRRRRTIRDRLRRRHATASRAATVSTLPRTRGRDAPAERHRHAA